MRCYQVIELLSLFRFRAVSNKPTKRTEKHAEMIFKFCDERCSLQVKIKTNLAIITAGDQCTFPIYLVPYS